jgi:hypothetical protein
MSGLDNDADFTAIKAEHAFDLAGAYFPKVPSFCQAGFKQAPNQCRAAGVANGGYK